MRIFLLTVLIAALTQACCMPSGTIALTEGETRGVEALLLTLDDYAKSTPDPRPARIHDHLVSCLEDGNMTRGVCGGENVLGRTCGEVVCLDSAVPYEVDYLRRNASACMLALAILYHEGVHLDQDFSDYFFGDHEKDAYKLTHEMQIWMAGEIASLRVPIQAATFDQDSGFEGLQESRRGMGTEYLSDVCPTHECRDQLQEFINSHPGANLAWIEVSARLYDCKELENGQLQVAVNFDRVLGKLSGQTKTSYFGRDGGGEAPTWSGPSELIASSKSMAFALGWYVADCQGGPSVVNDWNRNRIGPKCAQLDHEKLILNFDRPPGLGSPRLAFALTVLLLP